MLMTIMRATAVVTRDGEPLFADDHRSRLFGISIETIRGKKHIWPDVVDNERTIVKITLVR